MSLSNKHVSNSGLHWITDENETTKKNLKRGKIHKKSFPNVNKVSTTLFWVFFLLFFGYFIGIYSPIVWNAFGRSLRKKNGIFGSFLCNMEWHFDSNKWTKIKYKFDKLKLLVFVAFGFSEFFSLMTVISLIWIIHIYTSRNILKCKKKVNHRFSINRIEVRPLNFDFSYQRCMY